jgi:hypothetical protein
MVALPCPVFPYYIGCIFSLVFSYGTMHTMIWEIRKLEEILGGGVGGGWIVLGTNWWGR